MAPQQEAATVARKQQSVNSRRNICWVCMHLLLLVVNFGRAASVTNVTSLPGYPGELPFTIETGYIPVGELDDVELFYYFIESERNPVLDPLLFWLTGGPGCSGLSALLYETGPLNFDVESFTGTPTLKLNEYSWTKVASIIYIDQPVGAGFSYNTTEDGGLSSDTIAVADAYTFLRKWLLAHPQFIGNPLYIGGDSYSGIIVPMLVQTVFDGNLDGRKPISNLQGYILGNPVTNNTIDQNARIPFARRTSLISLELYQSLELVCNGDYINVADNNTECLLGLQTFKECIFQLNLAQILEPQCAFSSKKSTDRELNLKAQQEETIEYFLSEGALPPLWCRGFSYALSYMWANSKSVQEALGVTNGTVENWMRCPKSYDIYTKDVTDSIPYHQNLTTLGLRALIYSGDHDMSVPYVATLGWIRKYLDLSEVVDYRPWYVDGQVAGYMTMYESTKFTLTYATLKGAGHTAPEFKRKESLSLVDRWFAYYPI